MKKTTLIGSCLIILSISTFSQVLRVDKIPVFSGGIENLLVEINGIDESVAINDDNLSSDSYCYRLFLDLESYSHSATDSMRWKFLACGPSSDSKFALKIEGTQYFYNNTDFGSDKCTSIIPALLAIYPEVFYDSYVSDGRVGTDHVGVLRSVNEDGYIEITEGSEPPAPGITVPAIIQVFNNNIAIGYSGYDGWLVPGGCCRP